MNSTPVSLVVTATADDAMRPTLIIRNGPRSTRLVMTWDESRELRAQLEAAERMAGLLSDVEAPQQEVAPLSSPVTIYKHGPRTVRMRLTQEHSRQLRKQLKSAERNSIKRTRQR